MRFRGCMIAIALALVGSAADRNDELKSDFENLDFSQGKPGNAPPGWLLGPEWFMPPHAPIYVTQTVRGPSCDSGHQCAKVFSIREEASVPMGGIYQRVDVSRYRGKFLNLRAKTRRTAGDSAVVFVRIHKPDHTTSYYDQRSIPEAAWSEQDIHAPIGVDAGDVEFGFKVVGAGTAWIDSVSVTFNDNPVAQLR